MVVQYGLRAEFRPGNSDGHACTWVRGSADEIGIGHARVPGGVPEEEDVEEVVCDTEDGAVCEVEFFFPCLISYEERSGVSLAGWMVGIEQGQFGGSPDRGVHRDSSTPGHLYIPLLLALQ